MSPPTSLVAYVPTTRSRYEISIKECLAFCDTERVSQEACLPAGEMLLVMFAASLVGKIAGYHAVKAIRNLGEGTRYYNTSSKALPTLV